MAYPPSVMTPPVEAPQAPAKKTRTRREVDAFLKEARDRFQQAQEADHKQRERELADLRFYAGDQWPDAVKRAREGQAASGGLPAVPPRPCLVINKELEPVRQVLNQERQSDFGLELVPADDFGGLTGPIDATEVELREGLTRRIQRESEAADARSWAFMRAVIAGRGYYGVMTRYVPGKTWDQEIFIQRFYDQGSVSLDPHHEQPDGSDAEWAFVGNDIPWEQYKAEFKSVAGADNEVCSADDGDFRTLSEQCPGWFTSSGTTRTCRVVDYYYMVRTVRTLALLPDGSVVWEDELPEDVTADDTREVIEKTIQWAKIDGTQILDETDWPGPDIPIIKVLGEELQPYDAERRVQGVVRPSRDSQEAYNAMVSKQVEMVALAPIPPIMLAEGQDAEHEAEWDASTTRTLGRLHYRQKDLEGQPAPPPFATPRDVPIQAVAISVQMFDEAIQTTSGVHDPSVGKADPSLKSGRALNAVIDQNTRGTSHYLDNLKRSMRYEGQIINGLLYAIYGRPGRLARLITGQGEPKAVLLHQPFAMQGEGQAARPVPTDPADPKAQRYTLTKDAQFNVVVKVTKAYTTRREEEASVVAELLSAAPALMTWFGDLFFKNQDGPGHDEMAERAKVMLDPKILAMLQAKVQGVPEMPPQVQAQLAQIPQMQQALQQMKQALDTDQAKQQAAVQMKTLDLAFQREKLQADNETKIAVAELGAKVDRLALFLEERGRLGTQAHEAGLEQMGHAHAMVQGQQELAAVSQQQIADQAQQMADQQHQQAMAAQATAPEGNA